MDVYRPPVYFPPYVPISNNSNGACRALLIVFVDLNSQWCPGTFSKGEASNAIHARDTSLCYDEDCDGKFTCYITRAFRNCSKDFLQYHLSGWHSFKCPSGFVPVRPKPVVHIQKSRWPIAIDCVTPAWARQLEIQAMLRLEQKKEKLRRRDKDVLIEGTSESLNIAIAADDVAFHNVVDTDQELG